MRLAAPTWPICEEMLMIEPGRPAASSPFTTACATKKAALTLSPKMASKSVSVTVDEGARAVGPGIVDEDVERAVLGDRRGGRRAVGRRRAPGRDALPPASRTRRRGGLDLGSRAGGQDDLGARRGQRGGRRRGRCRGRRRSPARACRRGANPGDCGSATKSSTRPPWRRGCCGRHSAGRGHWPARRGRRSPRAGRAASNIRRSSRWPRR